MPNIIISNADDFDFEREVTDIPEDQTVATGRFAIRETEDSEAIITKDLTTGAVQGVGQIVIDDTTTVIVQLTDEDTDLLTPDIWYFYGLRVTTDADMDKQVEVGRLLAQRNVAREDGSGG